MALSGIMKKMLFVNLSRGKVDIETPDDKLYEKYIGGYGLGAYYIYNRQKARVDALGPSNMLGFLTGPWRLTEQLFSHSYPGQRAAQLVGQVGQQLLAGFDHPTQPIGHEVEGQG